MKNSIVVFWDFDDAGRTIGQSVLADDIQHLFEMSNKIDEANDKLATWCQSKNGKIVSKGGDQGVSIFSDIHDEEAFVQELEQIRNEVGQGLGATITMGAGLSLSQAGKALLAGKLSGKDQILIYDSSTDDILAQAHSHVADGSGNAEEQKLDEQYIDDMDQDDQAEDDDQDMMQDPMDQDQEFQDEDQDTEMLPEDQDQEQADQSEENPDETMQEYSNEEPSEEDEDQTQEDDGIQDDLDSNSLLQEDPDSEEMPVDNEFQNDEPTSADDDGQITDDQMEDQMIDDQDSDFENQPSIDIPESEEMQEDMEDPNQQDLMEDEQEQSPEFNDLNNMVQDSSSQDGEALKQQCAQVLSVFKEQKQALEGMAEQAPELYQATLGMLQCMVEMSKVLFMDQPQADIPQEDEQQDYSQEIPDEAEEQQVPKM